MKSEKTSTVYAFYQVFVSKPFKISNKKLSKLPRASQQRLNQCKQQNKLNNKRENTTQENQEEEEK